MRLAFNSHWRTQQIKTIGNFACKLEIHFLLSVVLGVVVVVAKVFQYLRWQRISGRHWN